MNGVHPDSRFSTTDVRRLATAFGRPPVLGETGGNFILRSIAMNGPHDRMYEAVRTGWLTGLARCNRASAAGEWAAAEIWAERCDRWADVRRRLLGRTTPELTTTALIPRSEIAAALAAHTQEIRS